MAIGEWNGVLKLDATNGASSTTDYSSSVVEFDTGIDRKMEEYHTIDNQDAKVMVGGRSTEMKLVVLADSPLATVIQGMGTVTRTLEWGEPDRNTAGSRTLACEVLAGKRSGAYKAIGGSAKVRVTEIMLKPVGTLTEAVVV